jgi:hypothetical protein
VITNTKIIITVSVKLEEAVLNLAGHAVTDTGRTQRLKPVAVDGGSIVFRPFQDG